MSLPTSAIMFHSWSIDSESSRLPCICSNVTTVGTQFIVTLTIKDIPIMIAAVYVVRHECTLFLRKDKSGARETTQRKYNLLYSSVIYYNLPRQEGR